MAEDNSVMVVAVLAVIASLAAAGVSYYSAVSVVPKISGYATGTANLTIETSAVINFSDALINWQSGRVNVNKDKAFLDTYAGSVVDGNWTVENTGLKIENIGNVNVTLALTAGKSATTFIGGTSPAYKWRVNNSEAGSCVNATNSTYGWEGFADVNTTTGGTRFCSLFQFLTSTNSVRIDINLTVPYDSTKGALGDIITATATAI